MGRCRLPTAPVGCPIPLTAFKDNIVVSHFLERFSMNLPSFADDAPPLNAVFKEQSPSSTIYISGMSLAEALFANVQKDFEMVNRSLETYGLALRNFRRTLKLVKKGDRSQAYIHIWSCLFLGLREMVNPSSTTNWTQHGRGMGILVS